MVRNMSDLRVPNVPLAAGEDEFDEIHSNPSLQAVKDTVNNNSPNPSDCGEDNSVNGNSKKVDFLTAENGGCFSAPPTPRRTRRSRSRSSREHSRSRSRGSPSSGEMDNFGEGNDFSGSLEDLVSNFDQKITQCFKNYAETTDRIAPVQVRTQEEIMSESQIWWTLTGNFGNILPIDWSKTQTRQLQLPALNLRPKPDVGEGEQGGEGLDLSEDEELAAALDLHSLIVTSALPSPHDSLPQTAEQVIEEIDEIMQGSSLSELTGSSDQTMESVDSLCSPLKSPLPLLGAVMAQDPDLQAKVREAANLASSEEKLQNLPYNKLVALQGELESLIQAYNESLVQELALKDELEYEKELKNSFISLLLSIQGRRRQFAADRKKRSIRGRDGANSTQPQYLTTVIPYNAGGGPPDNATLQALIKILKAVNEDNSNVPNMLTDYILNVLCPSANAAEAENHISI